ncbi:MAG: putative cytosolic protein [Deltaproteobacteria bacterium]|nr:putative cytosolic protein [Deltaproteobacteria bacterium]
MNLSDMRFPRQLEAAGLSEKIREALVAEKTRLWPEGKLEVPVLNISESLTGAIKKARMQRRVRFGFDEIFDKLASEKKGIDHLHEQMKSQQNERISRLLLFSNDGAERLYRHIEQTLNEHHLRILGCQLDTDGKTLGQLITGRSVGIKVILVEHKEAVSDVLRALVDAGK